MAIKKRSANSGCDEMTPSMVKKSLRYRLGGFDRVVIKPESWDVFPETVFAFLGRNCAEVRIPEETKYSTELLGKICHGLIDRFRYHLGLSPLEDEPSCNAR